MIDAHRATDALAALATALGRGSELGVAVFDDAGRPVWLAGSLATVLAAADAQVVHPRLDQLLARAGGDGVLFSGVFTIDSGGQRYRSVHGVLARHGGSAVLLAEPQGGVSAASAQALADEVRHASMRERSQVKAQRLAEFRRDRMQVARDAAVAASQLDALTGLDTRAHCLSKLSLALAAAAGEGTPVSALMIDLDHFKQVNDTWGHAAGDAVLREVGRVLRGLVRSGDSVGRYGGEELLMVLTATDIHTAAAVAERVRAAVAALALPGQPGVTTSVGGATARPNEDATALLIRADAALYAAKAAGRDQVRMAGEFRVTSDLTSG